MPDSTLLAFAEFDIPPYSARGITQRIEPISATQQLRRTVNGVLTDFSDPIFRKYQSTISCRDMDHPVLDDIWPGMQLTVDCIAEFKHRDATGEAAARTAVAGSERTADGYVYYRPQLTMLVTGFRVDVDEWGAEIGWTMELAEV